ncbi:tetraacyldisaccharide 4'-kinase [Chthoniobacter flavus Ellin428]|uniref:Tetraacyldisaccharide 4'-kinase n=1 Tax=Chthoniobacter flavus Ellin428 TaxID=497964 RepID=B4D1X3_9BACT|nr:tetraacyldisaccharide 4'-kinase [Chthoniobacter flavus]EDY19735.1 tetraacyldisaccharide 4'-kinase [Chthoniobacter flavus Ellin428]TCO92970.1 lipid-A-disaccharide kinase [Chthoniobacter flavus]
MRRWLEAFEEFAIDVILERRYGKRAMALRWFLLSLSYLFTIGVQTRLWLFRHRFLRSHHPACFVISIGNLTVGGTGKTPVVEKFARTLQDHGRRVAILSRGYKSKKPPLFRRLQRKWLGLERRKPRIVHDGRRLLLDSRFAGDEPYMLAKSLANVIVLVDKDRVRSAMHAIREMKCDTLILDDGMQYLHLKHRLEICLIDAQAPFGNEYLLPRGTLREPPTNLRRASYIFITKTPEKGNAELIERIREYNRTAEIVECRHQPLYLRNLYDPDDRKPLEYLQGRYIAALSGIARPESFEQSLVALGANLEITKSFADHHRFTDRELQEFATRCSRRDLDLIVTTEKDSVRFPAKIAGLETPVYYLRVEIEILSGHESWESLVERLCRPQKLLAPERFFP